MPQDKPSATASLLYGKGVFTTVAVRSGQCVFWDKHWLRLNAHAERLDIGLSAFTEGSVRAAVAEAIHGDQLENGRVRISLLDETASPLWSTDAERHTRLSIITGPGRSAPENVRLTVSPYKVNSTSPLAGIKSCNYLEPLLSLAEAKSRGFDEAIRLNELGDTASVCLANIFWLKDGRLFTPGLETGCLAGTTREHILENCECESVGRRIDDIYAADEIFLTSAGLGVVQVSELDGRKLQMRHHPILDLMPG